MIASIVITIFVSSVSVFLMSSSIAESSPPTLARFVDGDQSLQKLIEFPDVDDNVLTIVYCLAHVQKNGEIVRNHCFPSETVDPSLPDAIDTAAKLARASPATVGNKLRSVRLYYRVVFINKDGMTIK